MAHRARSMLFTWPTVACLCVCLLAACGGGSKNSPDSGGQTSSAAALDTCVKIPGTWKPLTGVPVDAAERGSGPTIVFANETGNDPCAWLELGVRLSAKGYRVVVFRYTNVSSAKESQSVKETLAVAAKASAGGDFALVGASLGGRVVIEAAAQHPAKLAGIVSLSGESEVEDYPDITAAARSVRTPALYIGARGDSLTEGSSQQTALHRAMKGDPNKLFQVAGSAHGTALLSGPTATPVIAQITSFLAATLH